MNNCLFCKFIKGELKSKMVYEDSDLIAIEDINPQAPLHILIIPKKHISTLADIKDGDKELIGSIYIAANKIAASKGIDHAGFRVVANCNRDGGQTVFHIHFHLLGGRNMLWPPG